MGKDIILAVLVILLVVLGYFTYDLYSKGMQCKTGVEQLQAGLSQCQAGVIAYQEALAGLAQIPACAPYIPAQ